MPIIENLSLLENKVFRKILYFSKRRKWKYGINESYILSSLIRIGFKKEEIKKAIQKLFDKRIIYYKKRYHNIYWFPTKKYRSQIN